MDVKGKEWYKSFKDLKCGEKYILSPIEDRKLREVTVRGSERQGFLLPGGITNDGFFEVFIKTAENRAVNIVDGMAYSPSANLKIISVRI